MAVLPKQLMQYFNEAPSIKTESLHFNHILTVKKVVCLCKYLWTQPH